MSAWRGFFISFEGLDGAGKSTQVASLAGALRQQGHDVVTVRPDETPLGEILHSFVLQHQRGPALEAWAEALLFTAERVQLLHETILPALRKGSVVIADRYADSTIAYQGGGRGIPPGRPAPIARRRVRRRLAGSDPLPGDTGVHGRAAAARAAAPARSLRGGSGDIPCGRGGRLRATCGTASAQVRAHRRHPAGDSRLSRRREGHRAAPAGAGAHRSSGPFKRRLRVRLLWKRPSRLIRGQLRPER